jgi:hypothetical protein
MLMLIIPTVFYAPFRTAFMEPRTSNTLFAIETMSDILLVVDIIITFLTPFERADGSMETNAKKVARNYVLGAFFMDFIACFPTQAMELKLRQFEFFDEKVSLS